MGREIWGVIRAIFIPAAKLEPCTIFVGGRDTGRHGGVKSLNGGAD